jgi:microcompartment protein CcmK/EutM
MFLAKVIGTVVASCKEPTLDGLKLLLVRPCDVDGVPSGPPVVAADAVGAGVGEVVLYVGGSSARQTEATQNRPIDHTVMAVVDSVALGEEQRYRKADGG